MSYRPPDTGDSLNDYFSSLTDFIQLSPNLIKASSEREFEMWLEKLEKIDRRALLLYIRKNKNRINDSNLALAKRRFLEEI